MRDSTLSMVFSALYATMKIKSFGFLDLEARTALVGFFTNIPSRKWSYGRDNTHIAALSPVLE
jgi:hypothetical protein